MDQHEEDHHQLREQSCPICLHNWTDPTALDNCQHIFCFDCIIEWTRLKPECPLCKCALQTLKHQLLLPDGEKPTWSFEGKVENIMELRGEFEMNQIVEKTSYPPDVEKHAVVQIVKSMLGELHSLRSLSITTYASESIYKKAIHGIEHEMTDYRRLLNMFNKQSTRAEIFAQPAFRRLIYRKNLMPSSICSPLFNQTFNSEYIKDHREAVKVHLIPFIIREITAITGQSAIDVGIYVEKLLDYFSAKIKRQEIVTFLNKRGVENPHHFLNNLLHYASTGQNLHVYDQNSEYTPRRSNYIENSFPEDQDVLILNSTNSDVEVIGERGGVERNQHRSRARERERHNNNSNSSSSNDNANVNNNHDNSNNSNTFALANNALLSHFMNQQQSQPMGSFDPNHESTSNSMFRRPDFRQLLDNISWQWSNAWSTNNRASQMEGPLKPMPPWMGEMRSDEAAGTSAEAVTNDNPRTESAERKRRKTLTLDDSDDGVQIVAEVQPKRSRELHSDSGDDSSSAKVDSVDNASSSADRDDDLELMDECE